MENEIKTNMFAKETEYQAIRSFIKILESGKGGGMAASMRSAVDEELTPRQRQLVYMYYIDQMRMQDIADELGLHVSSVSRTLKRGRKRLKTCLKYGGRALLNAVEN